MDVTINYPKSKASSFTDGVLVWFSANGVDFPWRKSNEPYPILIAEVLLKRTTAAAAARVYSEFLERFPSFRAIEATPEEEMIDALSGVGLQRQRARALKTTAAWILEKHDGKTPSDLSTLTATPGLGAYNAAAIACFAFAERVPIVDSNVERILTRVFGGSFKDRPSATKLRDLAQDLLPDSDYQCFNYGLLDLGRLVCRPAHPKCVECPVNSICDFFAQRDANTKTGHRRSDARQASSKLRELRIQRGLSLTELAKTANVSKLTVINIEADRTRPKQSTISKLASALNVDPTELSNSPVSDV